MEAAVKRLSNESPIKIIDSPMMSSSRRSLCGRASVWEHQWPETPRKAPVLPIMFLGDAGDSGGGNSVSGSMRGVIRNMGGASGVTGGAGRGPGREVIRVAGGGVSSQCGSTNFFHRYLAARPGTPGFDGFSRSVVLRILCLEEGKHVLGAAGSPKHQCLMIWFVESLHIPHLSYILP